MPTTASVARSSNTERDEKEMREHGRAKAEETERAAKGREESARGREESARGGGGEEGERGVGRPGGEGRRARGREARGRGSQGPQPGPPKQAGASQQAAVPVDSDTLSSTSSTPLDSNWESLDVALTAVQPPRPENETTRDPPSLEEAPNLDLLSCGAVDIYPVIGCQRLGPTPDLTPFPRIRPSLGVPLLHPPDHGPGPGGVASLDPSEISSQRADSLSPTMSDCLLGVGPKEGGSAGCQQAGLALAGNRLSLDVYPRGAALLPELWGSRQDEMLAVEFVRLCSNQEGIEGAVELLPRMRGLRSAVLKGGSLRDEFGACVPGLLSALSDSFSSLQLLTHLDLSFNRLHSLPGCVSALPCLSTLLLGHNLLGSLPESLGDLRCLTFLSLIKNRLHSLPASLGQLGALRSLDASHNLLEEIPEQAGALERLELLDLSANKLRSVPETLGNLLSLQQLHLHSNCLELVPASLAALPSLTHLDLQNNCLRRVPVEIESCPAARLRGNPLGQPETPQTLPQTEDASEPKDPPELHLSGDQDSFVVTHDGCTVFLPRGLKLVFPAGASSMVTVTWHLRRPSRKLVRLEHHDFLLSSVLELQPHGINFHKPVSLSLPYSAPRRAPHRQAVIRTFDGASWTDLQTHTVTYSRRKRVEGAELPQDKLGSQTSRNDKRFLACCSLSHFSWFMVVSQLVEECCSVLPLQGALLVSSADPGIKVTFPPAATAEARRVRMQVLAVPLPQLRELSGDPHASASPLLRLAQSSALNFLQPVRIQLPLPPGLTGLSLDRSRLHLLHGDPSADTWTDITQQVALQFTHLYAVFEVLHFSWYWLWYTTQRYVGGMVRRVYERLRLHQVQFMALQRKKNPEQVLLQCLPQNKVDDALERLISRYQGPEPSDLIDMLEGEQFFAGFEKGIEIDSDRPDCEAGRISFVFYSHLKNLKEVYVSSSSDRSVQPVRGQVSFYRGAMPESLPEEAAKKRKGPDSQWLTTLPLQLPMLRSVTEGGQSGQPSPLNLGDEESGFLTEVNLLGIALRIGAEWRSIGTNLGLSYQQLDRLEYGHRGDLGRQVESMLFSPRVSVSLSVQGGDLGRQVAQCSFPGRCRRAGARTCGSEGSLHQESWGQRQEIGTSSRERGLGRGWAASQEDSAIDMG
ncbi:p53-induced death domain-containing protein 1 [Huso huso]|uniref:P53-induced death domain-containing protein 1 n=1 Tax=Huso huso TaxID=61971 RepID=A0ABR0YJV7_HUSHU